MAWFTGLTSPFIANKDYTILYTILYLQEKTYRCDISSKHVNYEYS